MRTALPVAFLSAAILLTEGLLARILPLPDLLPVRAILTALPGGAFLAGFLKPVPRVRAALRADGDLGTGCLFQAAAAQADSRLAPVILQDAEGAAAAGLAKEPPALPLPRRTGAGSLALLLAAVVSFAPGRAARPDPARAALLARAEAAAAAAEEAARNSAWDRDQREELASAAREIRNAARDRNPGEIERALERIGSLIESLARGGKDFRGDPAREQALPSPRDVLSPGELETRIERLLDMLESGALDGLEVRETARQFREASRDSPPEQRGPLAAIAASLESGDLSGASGLARREMARAAARRTALQSLAEVVLEHGAGGLSGARSGAASAAGVGADAGAGIPAGDIPPPPMPRVEAAGLTGLQRLVLERYYASER